MPATPAAVLVGGSPTKGAGRARRCAKRQDRGGLATLTPTRGSSPSWATSRSSTAPGRASPTSPSASPSSPSWPVASPPSRAGGTAAGRPPSPGAGRSWPALILCIGLCLSELVSAYPTSGGIYWWASKLGGAKSGYYTGWLNLIGLLAIVASVAYGCATFLDLTLGFLFPGSYTSGNLDTIFLLLHRDPGHRRPGQHLLEPPALHLQQHLGVVARDRRRGHHPHPDLPAPSPRQRLMVFTSTREQHRVLRRQDERVRVHLHRPAHRRPADPVHDHRVRRLGPPLRGDALGGRLGRQGHLALHRLLGHRRLAPPPGLPLRRAERGRGDQGWWRRGADLPPGPHLEVGRHGPAHRHHRPALLHHGLHDELHPHALRLQPRRRRARPPAVVEARAPSGSRSPA